MLSSEFTAATDASGLQVATRANLQFWCSLMRIHTLLRHNFNCIKSKRDSSKNLRHIQNMADPIERINQLAASSGFPQDPDENMAISVLEDEIANFRMESAVLKETIKLVEAQLESSEDELKAKQEQFENFVDRAIEDTENAKKKSEILQAYMSTITDTNAFMLNQIAAQNEDYSSQVHSKCSRVHERANQVRTELKEMCELIKECESLKQQINS